MNTRKTYRKTLPIAILALALAGLTLGFTVLKNDLNQVTMKME